MKKEDLWKIYDSNYANDYNERYLLNPFSQVSSSTELNILKDLINEKTQWLDLGCGTGYFLSLFPGIDRAGLDMSPKMLEHAIKTNPDALFFKEGDFREKVSEWNNKWSLITCMWGAYCYVDSVQEVEKVIENIISWTSQGGAIFFPTVDLEDVRPNMQIPYEEFTDVFGGKIALTSVTWSWKEQESGKEHEHLVSPHIEHFIKLLEPHFETIEVIRYPPYMPGWVSRKAILAKGKRTFNENAEAAKVIWHEIPAPNVQASEEVNTSFVSPLAPISNKHLLLEVLHRVRSGSFYQALKRRLFPRKN
ncbi:class I SAM-dependent methyltransferase [Pedobacter heparinus]|uniref:class I SAM-dependent methyltransferase n=1 Tax=Pedobacter heparinus TaxID=984 RepID=UPI002931F5B6|nr:class I SAM-dependent methyltransferase [Pedobacter heparinus]